jgi:hypothetical protein
LIVLIAGVVALVTDVHFFTIFIIFIFACSCISGFNYIFAISGIFAFNCIWN